MATSNFHNVNATDIFAVQIESEWDYEDLIDNLKYEFKNHNDYSEYTMRDPSALHSYPSTAIGHFSSCITVCDDEVDVCVIPVVRSGYYEGCNLDWNVEYHTNGYEDDRYADDDKVQSVMNGYVEFIENIYSQYSERLGVFARFSNGETIYSKI